MTYYVAGIVAAGLLPALLPVWSLLALSLLLPLFWWRWPVPRWLCSLLTGVLVASVWGHYQLSHRPVALNSSEPWQLSGQVASLPEQKPGMVRFNLRLDRGNLPPELRPLRQVRLSWYRPSEPLQPGMQLSVQAKLYRPSGMANPGGFDYPRWLLSRGIDATGYVKQLQIERTDACCVIARARATLLHALNSRFESSVVRATLAALILGVRDELSDDQWEVLRKTGTVHLVVISGLHIGFAALAGGWLGGRLYRGFSLFGQDQRPALVMGALLFAIGYLLISGSGLAAQRAVVMISAFLLSWLWMRNISHWQRWWLALALVLTLSPLAFFEPGLWLSFAAVALLLWFGGIRHQPGVLWRTQLAIMVGLFPLLVYWFDGSSLLAPLVNLVAIPATAGLLLVSGSGVGLSVLFGIDLLLPLISNLIEGFWWLLSWCAGLDLAWLALPAIPFWALLLATVGSLLMLLPPQFPARALAAVCWLPMLAGVAELGVKPAFEIWLFDVGQGLSVLVRAGERAMLYDTGPAWRSGRSAFQSAVQPALQQLQVKELDLLILSHRDNDHAGGRHHLLDVLSAEQRLSGSARLVREEGYTACKAGQQWQWGSVRMAMLAGSEGVKENDRSCVLHVSYNNCSLLLTGDIGFEQEARLPALTATWLVASHHGSRFGTSDRLLQRSQPELLLFSAGANNPFGHPHPDVIARAQAHQVPMVATSRSGAIKLWVEDSHCRHQGWRAQQRRYWQIPSAEEYGRVASN